MTYRINDIYPCLQGEGAKAGIPMVLVRLQGCAVGCPWCDTKETWDHKGGREMTAGEIAKECERLAGNSRWVMLTGGEPGEQDLEPLCSRLWVYGLRSQVETSGTAPGVLNPYVDWLTLSPKVGMPGGKPILDDVLHVAHEIKHVVGKREDIATLDDLIERRLRHNTRPFTVSLQPISQSVKATRLCIDVARERGWRVSLQMHKYIGER